MTTFSDSDVPGTSRVLLPVAMMTLSNVTVSVPPSLRSTSSVCGVGELAVAVDLGDLVLLHQEVHAGDAAVGDLAAAVEGDPVVEGRLAADAELLGFLGEDVRELGVAQQRLGRDAADVEADPAPVLGFDDCGVQPELGGANGRDVSAGAGSENDDVIVGHAAQP